MLSDDVRTLAHEAYVYLYPLVTMEVTRQQAVNTPEGARPAFGPPNRFHHLREFPPADFRAVVRPNFDTLYSSAWLDLTGGPVRLEVPDSGDRYYMLPMLDMWTDVFASPGKRTTGTGAQDYVITGPGYDGELPEGTPVIEAPTPYVWIIGRTQTNGPADYAAVHEFQDGLRLTELGAAVPTEVDPGVDITTEPLRQVNTMSAVDLFALAARLLAAHPPHATDHDQLARLARLGLVPGEHFDASRFDERELAELESGVQAAREGLPTGLARYGAPVNGWSYQATTMGVYGNDYFKRALVTLVGLGANPPEDAVYPLLLGDADGSPVSGQHRYEIHFDAADLPPVHAFWSVTMYDEEGFQAPNELDRFALGDRDPLVFGPDGSLDLYLQHDRPSEDRVPNWLPAPEGPLGVTMRLYAPRPEALDGTWRPPAVRRVS